TWIAITFQIGVVPAPVPIDCRGELRALEMTPLSLATRRPSELLRRPAAAGGGKGGEGGRVHGFSSGAIR
ncbi:hypothetical protein GTP91_30395, partial [Rugamonas sp. FT82W]|nr:hypothetical protein [Duganella vulcania]